MWEGASVSYHLVKVQELDQQQEKVLRGLQILLGWAQPQELLLGLQWFHLQVELLVLLLKGFLKRLVPALESLHFGLAQQQQQQVQLLELEQGSPLRGRAPPLGGQSRQ